MDAIFFFLVRLRKWNTSEFDLHFHMRVQQMILAPIDIEIHLFLIESSNYYIWKNYFIDCEILYQYLKIPILFGVFFFLLLLR